MKSENQPVSGQHSNAPVDLHAMAQIKSIRRWHQASVALIPAILLLAMSMPLCLFFDVMTLWFWVFVAFMGVWAGFVGLLMLGFDPLDESGLRELKDLMGRGCYVKAIDKKSSRKGKVLRRRDLDRAYAEESNRREAAHIASYVQSVQRMSEEQGDAK